MIKNLYSIKIQTFQSPILKTGISGMIDLIYDLVNLQIRRYIYLQPYLELEPELELEMEVKFEPSGAMPSQMHENGFSRMEFNINLGYDVQISNILYEQY